MSRLASKPTRPKATKADDDDRPFEVGTTGWTVADLDDPAIEARWFAEPLEIIEGVLTRMPPAYFDGGFRLDELEQQIRDHGRQSKLRYSFVHEADIVIGARRIVRADAAMMAPGDRERFVSAATAAGKRKRGRQRIYAPPTLIIESVSPGHAGHDRETKFRWYAEFGVPNYWIFEPLKKSLDCYTLSKNRYVLAAAGTAPDKFNVPYFDGLKIDLGAIFAD